MVKSDEEVRRDLRTIMEAGIAAAHPDEVLPPAVRRLFPDPPGGDGRTIVLGAGKAAAHMARAFERAYPWDCQGFVVTRYGYSVRTDRLEVVEAAHPVPDPAGEIAAQRVQAAIAGARPHDRVVFLLSGGASSLLPRPIPGVTLEMKRHVSRALLASGAPIVEMNRVRSALSLLKGGGLVSACPAPITTLAISDVVGDDPAAIGSGPTWAAAHSRASALPTLDRLAPDAAAALRAFLANGGAEERTGEQGPYEIVARAENMLDAAREKAASLGYHTWIEDAGSEGEAQNVARAHASRFRALRADNRPAVMLSGGELTVTMPNVADDDRTGGPNQEYALAAALALAGKGAYVLAVDSDGVDGRGDAAGALLGPMPSDGLSGTHPHARALRAHNTGSYLDSLNALVRTGPTGTNVNDLRVIMVAEISKT